ncbi:MAG: hypothetical protein M0R75_02270 [Dehalococcoidia bacterium]|nr:hypothetical protein [Dehalococcoidia bacterium]
MAQQPVGSDTGLSDHRAARPVDTARAHATTFGAQAEQQEAAGALTEASLAPLRDANLFGLMAPAELGGLEASPCDTLETFEEVSRAEGAVGWVLTTCAFATGLAGAFLGDDAAAEVFRDGMPIIAGAGAPVGRARTVEGGFVLDGRWSYGSGIRHATHTHNGALILDPDGEVRSDLGPHIFVTPIEAATLDDQWDVLGLRGTGSVDYAIEDCFLPDGFGHQTRGAVQRRGGATYTIGTAGMSTIAHTGFFLGIGRRVLDELADVARTKGAPGSRLTDSETFLDGYAAAEAGYRAARALVFETWRAIEHRIALGAAVDVGHIAAAQVAMCHLASASTDAATFAYQAGGGTSLRQGALQRAFRDTFAGRQHARVSGAVMRANMRTLLLAGPSEGTSNGRA